MPDVKERPIIFSDAMVLAIREGRKTQTRRVIVPRPVFERDGGVWYPSPVNNRAKHYASETHFRKGVVIDFYPYGVPGDRLWVKETWFSPEYASTGKIPTGPGCAYYRADGDTDCWDGPWKSARYMPRWASRILLELTDVRVQQVQEIGEADAMAEGVLPEDWEDRVPAGPICTPHVGRIAFRNVWDSLNYKRGYGWEANPWVWALAFKVLDA